MKVLLSQKTVFWFAALALMAGLATGATLLLSGQGPRSAGSLPAVGEKKKREEAASKKPAGKVDVKVHVGEDQRKEITHPAYVLPYEQTDIQARVSGYLQTIQVDIGDRVKRAQELAILSLPEMKAEELQRQALEKQAKAQLVQAKATLPAALAMVEASKAKLKEMQKDVVRLKAEKEFRNSELERYAKLYKDGTIQRDQFEEKLKLFQAAAAAYDVGEAAVETAQAKVKVEDARRSKAEADVQSAVARVEVARANLEHTRTMLSYGTLRAPFDGIVTRRLVHTGAFIQSAASGKPDPLLTVVRIDRLRIVADIPAADAVWLTIGQPASLEVNSLPHKFPGTLVRMAHVLDGGTRTLRIEIELKSIPKGLRPGMFGYVTITGGLFRRP